MYFDCKFTVVIGDKILQTVHSISTKNDSKELGSTCKIVVPLASRIQYKDGTHDYLTDLTRNLFKSGDAVTITAWYIDENKKKMPDVPVFKGFVYEFIEGTPMTIECMDNLYLLNQTTVNLHYQSITLKQLLINILATVKDDNGNQIITLMDPTVGLTLSPITFRLMSPAACLEYLKKELGLNMTLTGSQLYCNLASNIISTGFLDTTRNVIRSNLQKPEAVFLKLKVKAWFILPNGKKTSLEVGDPDGELREVFFYNVLPVDVTHYTKLAGEALIKYKQMKFSGNIETYLYADNPNLDLFWRVQYLDKRYPDRNGNYLVMGHDFEIGPGGFHRRIRLSFLSDIDSDVDALAATNQIVNFTP